MKNLKKYNPLRSALMALGFFCLLQGSLLAADGERTISYPETYNTKIAGASPYIGQIDVTDSPYFKSVDFYSLKTNDQLTILPNYKTYQQTTEITCGPAAALTVLHHFGVTNYTELELAGSMDTKYAVGTSVESIANFFKNIRWNVQSSLTAPKFTSFDQFALFVNGTLKENTPILVENVDWGGHWRVIIGYDTMGTTTVADDMLIMADPYDTSDHRQDGYVVVPAVKFYYMWFDHEMMPKNQREQGWVVAKP